MTPKRREGPAWNSQTKTFYIDEKIGFPPNARRVRIALGTSDEAEANRRWRWRRDYEWKKSLGLAPPESQPRTMTLSVLCKEYVAYLKDLKRAQSWKVSESRLKTVREIIGDISINALDRKALGMIDAGLRTLTPSRSEATINHYIKTVRALYNYAIRKKIYRGDNPTADVKPYLTKSNRRAYSPAEMEKILSAAAEIARETRAGAAIFANGYRLTLLLYLTGARLGELLNLKWESVKDDGSIVLERTETKQRRRKIIPITAKVRAILDELATERKDEYVFPFRRRGGGRFESNYANKLLLKIRERSGVADFIFHGLRHTATTLLSTEALGRGATLADVMLLLGHSRAETTLRYTHADIDRMRSALEMIPEVGYNPDRREGEKGPEKKPRPSRMRQGKRVAKRK